MCNIYLLLQYNYSSSRVLTLPSERTLLWHKQKELPAFELFVNRLSCSDLLPPQQLSARWFKEHGSPEKSSDYNVGPASNLKLVLERFCHPWPKLNPFFPPFGLYSFLISSYPLLGFCSMVREIVWEKNVSISFQHIAMDKKANIKKSFLS